LTDDELRLIGQYPEQLALLYPGMTIRGDGKDGATS
jgi:hypothetical protein